MTFHLHAGAQLRFKSMREYIADFEGLHSVGPCWMDPYLTNQTSSREHESSGPATVWVAYVMRRIRFAAARTISVGLMTGDGMWLPH